MPDPAILVAMLWTVLGIYVLARINFYLKMLFATFQCAVHHHGYHFGVTVLEGLVLDVNIFWFGSFPYTVSVLTMFGTVFRNMNAEENLAAPRIKTLFFPEFLAPS